MPRLCGAISKFAMESIQCVVKVLGYWKEALSRHCKPDIFLQPLPAPREAVRSSLDLANVRGKVLVTLGNGFLYF